MRFLQNLTANTKYNPFRIFVLNNSIDLHCFWTISVEFAINLIKLNVNENHNIF